MYSNQQVSSLFGNESLQYLQNKNRGGISNEQGNTYENHFAIYKIALMSIQVLEKQKRIKFYSQIFAFVDDLIISCESDNILEHYQLKNSNSISWGSGQKSISDDFEKQKILNQQISKFSEIYLVVSSESLREKLSRNCPQNIQAFSQATYFPYKSNLMHVVAEIPSFCEAIEYLSAFENPDPDKIECVATVLLGAWMISEKSEVSVQEILTKAQDSSPSYIRSFRTSLSLDSEVSNILGNIETFSYNLAKGFMHWQYEGKLETGTYPYRIDHVQFQRFQELIKERKPTNFEELEVFL